MLTIFNKNGQMRTAIEPSDNSTQTKEVQGENLLNISFTHYEHIPLDVLEVNAIGCLKNTHPNR